MSDETNEPQSVEAEAEQIVRDALADIDLDGEDCPQGDLCAVHHRVDEEVIDEELEYGRLITYVGDYVVITTDNPQLDNPLIGLKLLLGQVKLKDLPLYETCVVHVGEGALADVRRLSKDGQRESIRFVQNHNEWDNFKVAHEVVVNGVREDLIDVSSPAFPRGK